MLNDISDIYESQISNSINQLLELEPGNLTEIPEPDFCGRWFAVGSQVGFDTLEEFVGVIDLETTGLESDAKVLCAVAIGTRRGRTGVWYWSQGTQPDDRRLPVRNSTIANWNQPFDRRFYELENGKETNLHIDLRGLTLVVRGKPEEWAMEYEPSLQSWESYAFHDLTLRTVHQQLGLGYLDKSERDAIILNQSNPTDTLNYCLEDVRATIRVMSVILREYLMHVPNPISVMGNIIRHCFTLPISEKWDGYIDRVNEWYQGEMDKIASYVEDLLYQALIEPTHASHLCIHDRFPDRFQKRRFLGGLGWVMSSRSVGRGKSKSVRYTVRSNRFVLALLPLHLHVLLMDQVGLLDIFTPRWFWESINGGLKPTRKLFSLVVPLTYGGHDVLLDETGTWVAGGKPMPNLGDPRTKLSTPMSKEYLKLLESGELGCDRLPEGFGKAMGKTVFWRMFRARIGSLKPLDGWLTPDYSPVGTLSSRAADKVFLLATASVKPDVGGSELFSMIEAKPGYSVVQADLDSAELVLAGLIATNRAGFKREDEHPFSAANLNGSKEQGTDLHTLVAKKTGMTRDRAKNLVYGGNYGQGDAARIEQIMRDCGVSKEEAESLNQLFKDFYLGDLAKDMFDGLNLLTECRHPSALLGRVMPQAYLKSGRKGKTSINNHHVQTLGVDWLDTLECLIMELVADWTDRPQLILTRHDELIYHVKSDQVEEFKGIMQLAHKSVKLMLLQSFAIEEPSEAWLWFSSVDSSDRYRKSPTAPISTLTTQF